MVSNVANVEEKGKTDDTQERSILSVFNFGKYKKCLGKANKKFKNFVKEIQKRGSRYRSLISSTSGISKDMTKLVSVFLHELPVLDSLNDRDYRSASDKLRSLSRHQVEIKFYMNFIGIFSCLITKKRKFIS